MSTTPSTGSRPHYALYARVPPEVAASVDRIRAALQRRFPGTFTPATEPAHLTVLYGPALAEGEREALTRAEALCVYPGADEALCVYTEPTRYRGVAHFIRERNINVHLEFANSRLDCLHTTLRDRLPGVQEEYKKLHAETRAYDQSYASPPRRWLHLSLGTVPATGPTYLQDLVCVEDAVRDLADEELIGAMYVCGIDLVSAVTDTHVRIV